MAMEACKQLADKDRAISGFTIKDATFHNPLPVSAESDGVEVQLCLRTEKDSLQKDSLVSSFQLFVNNNGVWDKNCRGQVRLDYETAMAEFDAGKENAARLSHHRQVFDQARTSCNRSVPVQHMYEHLSEIGLGTGPAFQGIREMSYNDFGEAIGKVRVFQWAVEEGKTHRQEHIIHPTTLDSFFQFMMAAISKGTTEDMPTMMITCVTNLWLSNAGISYPATPMVDFYAKAAFTGIRRSHGHIFALDPVTNNLLASIEETEATTVANRDTVVENHGTARGLCYSVDWKPDLDLSNHQQALAYCESSRPNRDPTSDFYEDLGYALIKFMSDALDSLGDHENKLQPKHLPKYIEWMKYEVKRFHAQEVPSLSDSSPKWTALQNARSWESHYQRLEVTAQGRFFVRIGRNLPQILNGDLDPLTFMFENDAVPEFYREVNNNVICYEPLLKHLDAMSHKNPGLRILEIGAGTGASTDIILDALNHHDKGSSGRVQICSRYDYTDISPAFFGAATDRYERYGETVNFKVLDIELDPSKQGFDVGSYDLIIAASVGSLSPCVGRVAD